MSRSALAGLAAVFACLALAASLARPQPAVANPLDKVCSVIGTIGEGWMGKACHVVAHPKQAVGVAKALLSGKPAKAIQTLLNEGKSNILSPSGALGITAIVAWAVGGAHFVLSEIAKFVGQSTAPELTASWFSSVYLRVAGVAALLTLPFLFAAAIQAMLRSDGALIARAVFGYLPLAFLATAVAAPIAMMLLAVTDWLGASVAKAAGDQGSHFLVLSGAAIGALGVAAGSPFVTFLIALLTAAGGLILWLELLVREAAVYVVVLMLPLVFAAMVWPARRIWAIRSVEILVALILAKFAIVSVLALAAAALGHGGGNLIVRSLAGLVLVMLGAFAPWVLLRLLPLAEVASAVAGHVRDHAQARITNDVALGRHGMTAVREGAAAIVAHMNSLAADANDAARRVPDNTAALAASAGTDRPMEDHSARQPTSSGDSRGSPQPQPSTDEPTAPGDTRPTAGKQRPSSTASGEVARIPNRHVDVPPPPEAVEPPASGEVARIPDRHVDVPPPPEAVERPAPDNDEPALPPPDPEEGAQG